MSGTLQGGTRGGGAHSLPIRREAADQKVLVVGHGMSIKGTIQDVERLVIEGVVESEIVHVKELVIMAGGVFRGDGDVEDAEIAGTFDGGLTVHGVLTVCHTGHLIGKATYCRLKIDDGGQVTGQLEMLKANKPNVVAETASDLSKVFKKQGPSAE
ncbi:MAG: polymer-forming cytoskeletal protein [Acetobacter sp.]|nr:polymer-forming cytoskeletal protein [Acetobacter sp.]